MARLTTEMGIGETLLGRLKQYKIFTILDFLQEDPEKISTMCDVNFKDVVEVRHNLITNFSALPTSGTLAYSQMLSNSALIPSGIKSLDELLQGGFLTGSVFELCGLSGEGKTQLCFTIAANVAAVLKQGIHYVDAKGDFSARRVFDIMRHKDIPEEECQAALDKISLTSISDIYELVRFLHQLKKSIDADGDSPTPRVVIVDSIPVLYFPFMTSEKNQGLGLLNHVMTTMKSLVTEYHMLFIVVNLASSFVEVSEAEVEEEGKEELTSELKPMLGKYWLHAPSTRLLVSRLNNEAPQRIVRVLKSTHLPLNASCIVSVSQKGVV